ncbi:TrkH family potassium uptake protein [Paenibacillus daejeonensis]|uniref:TrkH family potassium uptake protein n=1 Tax=Paenibacillus daejeonensis TaxID=135193 RepID=UPI00037F3738|nr:TrkH family potassium uptake protein [Paenibacillus daejeonensis]
MNKKLLDPLQKINPPQLIMIVFIVLIGIGTLMLALPVSSAHGESVGLLNAWFTATSAVCVNGLVVLDTGSTFSTFGQIIIMVLIQIGGLGFMTLGVMVAVVLGKQIGLKQRLIIQQTTQSSSSQGMVRLSLYIATIVFVVEAFATVILAFRWKDEMGVGAAVYNGLFHAVSAFNNAGFALWSDSLSQYTGDPIVIITIFSLFLIGGLGYIVVVDLVQKRSWWKLSLHSKVVLLSSGILLGFGFVILFFLESWNASTFGQLTFGERVLAAFFQGATPRSAGFNSIDIGSMLTASQFVLIFLMFVGAASGGTGGGIKVNTFVVLLLATINTFRGGKEIHAFRRTINQETVMRALAVVISSLGFVLVVAFLLNITENLMEEHFLEVLFEATSAFSTTGLSMGLTSELSPLGKCIVIVTMFAGRLGPLTLAFALAHRRRASKLSYPEDNVLIG